jgi:serine/threonine protein kinase/formylglycine-generating enzyme required for sulfatase activity
MDDASQTGPPTLEGAPPSAGRPPTIGRYKVKEVLGQGGFGVVYLAYDDQLERHVAIKVPRPQLVSRPEEAQAYLTEARIVAGLDHPHIVPVHDVGSSADCPCFIVSKFIEGSTLERRLRGGRPSVAEAAELVATVAQTLHHAHLQGLVHRDIKPGNILLDKGGRPYVADFGTALREQEVGQGPRYVGTPAYMSPEQARGEGHRVDGRSDIFSLGIVLYELLTGRCAFEAPTTEELLGAIANAEVRPPRQWDDSIPKELERICLRALAKRASERYPTAHQLADDLRQFLALSPEAAKGSHSGREKQEQLASPAPSATPGGGPLDTPASAKSSLQIVPKGFRSFDAHDADFFLELLPGPRDRHGLPDSLRFWKTRIEETDADNTFAVGLLYGPSGCGKSSLVQAGLLPRLSDKVLTVYVEATAAETERRLQSALHKQCPGLAAELALVPSMQGDALDLRPEMPRPETSSPCKLTDALATLRRGGGRGGKKVLIVLDQFEQWLHGRKDETNPELVQALRQCDGGRVQCLILVGDDFWLGVSRFMKDLEIRLVEGKNSALIDLFDFDHAHKVLAAFGRALGKLPEPSRQPSKEQRDFLNQVIAWLAQENKVVCVRLALFVEMMKGRSWTPAALKAVGGTAGLGVTFLEETFGAAGAHPRHRYHQQAARAVLKAFLPEAGTDIKGQMRFHADLLALSGYAQRPRDFDSLLAILDGELRLITPTDPEGQDVERNSFRSANQERNEFRSTGTAAEPPRRFYQLTHDYLVPSLREWLTCKQKETRRGRAELLLTDRAAVWSARSENRQLPSLWQWWTIRRLTRKQTWTPAERKLMGKASRYHATRFGIAVVILACLGLAGWESFGRLKAHTLRDRLLEANISDVPRIVEEMAPYRRWVDPLLTEAQAQARKENNRRNQLHLALALLPVDTRRVDYLYERLLDAEPQEGLVLRQELISHKAGLSARLWRLLEDHSADMDQRFRAACVLAAFTPQDPRWNKVATDVAERLISQNALVIGTWAQALQPVGESLLPPLAALLQEEKRSASDRNTIVSLIMAFSQERSDGVKGLEEILAQRLQEGTPVERQVALAKRQANVAAGLLAMGHADKVWPLLASRPDPTLRCFLMERLAETAVNPQVLLARFAGEQDRSIKRAMLLSLGEFGLDRWPLVERHKEIPKLVQIYREDPDPGLHAAAAWLLSQWGQGETLKVLEKELRREESRLDHKRGWYVNGQGQTMAVIPGPVEFTMGSPPDEPHRTEEDQYQRRLERTFAIAATPVTKEQFLRYLPNFTWPGMQYHPDPSCPVGGMSWHEAAAYCNWLSQQEGIEPAEWCYEIDAGRQVTRLKDKYLSLRGYRLPTEAEWEYACRAGAKTRWHFGQSEALLGRYAWYAANSGGRTWPVGTKKPNDLGLFDMHGNVYNWCQDKHKPIPPRSDHAINDREDDATMNNQDHRVLRGGSYNFHASQGRAAFRIWVLPATRVTNLGFRVARTYR